MIVWSRGLGKQRLPLKLPDAILSATSECLIMEGVIEPICWNYAIRLAPNDLREFLKLMAAPRTAEFLAEHGGVLWPFLSGLIAIVPRLIFKLLVRKTQAVLAKG
jgi:hypothetical protein